MAIVNSGKEIIFLYGVVGIYMYTTKGVTIRGVFCN